MLFWLIVFVVKAQSGYKVENNILILPEPIIFELHANDVFDANDPMLDYVATYLSTNKAVNKLRIESHVFSEKDSIANTKLSLQRAAMISYYLTTRGIDCKRLVVCGFGSNYPLTLSEDDIQQDNTRIQFIIQELNNKNLSVLDFNICKLYDPCEE